jgi:VWFA-related protein
MRKLLCVLLFLPLMAPAQEPVPTLRTTTSEVLLDFVVRDKHQNAIRDLKPGEVQIFEDGVPQKMRHFEFVDGHSMQEVAPAPAPDSSSPASSSAAAPVTAPADTHTVDELREISVVSLVIADLDPRGRKLTIDAMRQFVSTEMRPNTFVGVFALGLGGLVDIQPYTNDAEKITAAVDRVAKAASMSQLTNTSQLSDPSTMFGSPDSSNPIGTQSIDPNNSTSNATYSQSTSGAVGPAAAIAQFMDTSWVSEMQDVYQESTHILTPLRMLVQAQADIPGRKVVLLLSAGLPVQIDTTDFLKGVISAANRANVTFYAVDTLGYTSQSTLDNSRRLLQHAATASRQMQMSKVNGGDQTVTPSQVTAGDVAASSIHADTMGNLAELAEGTGGELLPPSLDLREPLRRVMEDVQSHYELAYSPANTQVDGSFRKIEVKVLRKGAVVFARSGYFAVPKLNGRDIFPFEIATLKALGTRPQLHQFDFHAAALQFRPGPQQTQLSFVFQAPTRGLTITKDGQWLKVNVDVTALIKDEQGQIVAKISKEIPYEVPVAKMDDLKRGIVSFTSPFFLVPGHYTLETAVVDRLSMKASISRIALMVDQDSGLSMSDVEVARRIEPIQGPANPSEPLQAHGGLVTPELSDTVQPDAAGKVTLYAVAYPQAPVDAPVDATLELWRNGQLVMKTPASDVPPDATGAASILASLKTEKLPPGHYQAQVSFEYKGQKVEKRVVFNLAGAS